jgi:hypothetical protein
MSNGTGSGGDELEAAWASLYPLFRRGQLSNMLWDDELPLQERYDAGLELITLYEALEF